MDRAGTRPAERSRTVTLGLRALTVVALAVSAYIHVDLASGPRVVDGDITLAGLFLGQAIVAALVALWVLVAPSRLAWLAAAGVAAASLVALVLSVYVNIPAIGPFPPVYEPFWYTDKVVAAVAAGVATVTATAGLLLAWRR